MKTSEWTPHVQVPENYYSAAYDEYDHWLRYYWIIRNMVDRKVNSVLEVGVGSGVVASYLRNIGVQVTTFDIDPSLKPDHLGSVTELPFRDGEFEAISCCEVLEHMPFEQSEKAIGELYRVAQKYVVVSVPYAVLSFAFLLRLPILQLRELRVRLPFFRFNELKQGTQHHWELGRKGFPPSRLKNAFTNAGFKVASEHAPATNYSSAFFVLEK